MAGYPPLYPPEPGNIELVVSEASVRLVLAGELDLAAKAPLLEAVRQAVAQDRPVEVDTRRVTFMDSSAIATLSRLIRHTSHRPVFVEPPEVVRFLLEVTQIGQLVDVVDESRTTDTAQPAPMSTTTA
jgi:anti-anti-sigma factor